MAADRRAARTEILHGVLELRGREIRKLERDRGQRDEAVGMLLAPGREAVVVDSDDLLRELARLGIPPVEVHAQRLDVDAARVHRGESLGPEH